MITDASAPIAILHAEATTITKSAFACPKSKIAVKRSRLARAPGWVLLGLCVMHKLGM